MHRLRKRFTMARPVRRIMVATATIAGALTAVLATSLPAQAVPVDGQVAVIHNVNSTLCLAIGNASTAPGAKAIQWTCEPNHAEQQWDINKVPGTSAYFQIKNVNSGLCLVISQNSTTRGAAVVQMPCDSTNLSQWWLFDLKGSSYNIYNAWSGGAEVMAIGQASMTPGATAIQWPFESGHAEQQWTGPKELPCNCS